MALFYPEVVPTAMRVNRSSSGRECVSLWVKVSRDSGRGALWIYAVKGGPTGTSGDLNAAQERRAFLPEKSGGPDHAG